MNRTTNALQERIALAWMPYLGDHLAEQLARQRIRYVACFCGLLLGEIVLSLASVPPLASAMGEPAQVAVLVLILLATYALPLLYLVFTRRISRLITARLSAEGIRVSRSAPRHSRRAFTKWTARLGLSQEQLVGILETSLYGTTR